MDWSFDSTLLTNHYGGEYFNQYMKEHPVHWRDIIHPALKRAQFFFYQQDKVRWETLRVWLLHKHPNLNRAQLSAHSDVSLGWRDAIRQAKYNDGFISEGERIIRGEYGLPAYEPSPTQCKMNIAPLEPPEKTVQYDPERREYIIPEEIKKQFDPKQYRPIKYDEKTLAAVQKQYGPSVSAHTPSPEPEDVATIEPHLLRYLQRGQSQKRKHSSSLERENSVES